VKLSVHALCIVVLKHVEQLLFANVEFFLVCRSIVVFRLGRFGTPRTYGKRGLALLLDHILQAAAAILTLTRPMYGVDIPANVELVRDNASKGKRRDL
jgi:hypothetical protein